MRSTFLIALAAAILIAGTAWLQDETPRSEPFPDRTNLTLDAEPDRAGAESDSPKGCQTGCSISSHPVEPLIRTEYLDLVRTYASRDAETRLSALETLLFHAPRTRQFMDDIGTPQLGATEASILREELSKTHVRLWLRIVDQDGTVRAKIDGALFAISQKTHIHMTSTRDLSPPEVSGTIYRTGLHHLWTRI